ncbi:bicaudal C homolog 2 [Scleropages formosus]|uniref:bicaudal C homolog 2 n=1 Tax=Scleropages formosus TaxID=113540 RepID=UPI0010FA6B83|nr:protein bicaudal C homolog 1-like [Scleropages formosus]
MNPEPRDPDWVEERFRIDRKKLEMMLHTPPDEDGMTGEEFFEKVMIETDTQIKWPSKLKIGAKSKKDPHVKVEGKRHNVMKAKKKILDLLETKVNKVTLKIDVTHTEHSHVIGKGGGNIKKVMEVTACHIHFPDSNRHNATGEKSNQVSIAGPVEGVEFARRRIRDLQPLVLTFDLPMALAPQSMPEVTSPVVQHVAQAFGVSVTFQQQPKFYSSSCMVRGLQGNCASVKKATCVLMELLLGAENHATVSAQLDIGSHQHLLLLGHSGASFLSVMHLTQTQIILPDLSAPQSTPSLLIQGAPDGVCLARQQLLECLPVCLMFDMRENGEVDSRKLAQIMQNLGVFISIKPKVKQTAKSVVVKTLERNVGNLYEARRFLLGLEASELTSSTMKPICDVSLTSLGNHWLNLMMQQLRLLDPIAATTPEGVVGALLQVKPRPSPPPGLSGVHEEGDILLKGTDPKPAKTSEEKGQLRSATSGNPRGQKSDVGEKAPPSRRNSQSEATKDQRQEGNAMSQKNCKQLVNAEVNSVNKERRNSKREDIVEKVSDSTSNKDYDYERKKLLATRAMQKKPVETEVRTPTDTWSGLGFSKSMPEEAIKELRSISRRNPRSYLGTSSTQTWTSQGSRDRLYSGSNSDNWRERRASSPPSSPAPHSSCSSSSNYSSSSRSSTDRPCDNYFEGVLSGSRAQKTTDDLPELFSQLGLSKYIDIFQQQEIDFQTFLTLSDADLKEVGVSTFGARRKMLLAISDLNKSRRKPVDPPTVKSGYLEGGASGRLPRIMDMDAASQSSRW